ncbi:MAG: hypothetical protein R2795_21455 [Saprospiraceae bacterium]
MTNWWPILSHEHSPFAASILTELRHNTNDTLRIGTPRRPRYRTHTRQLRSTPRRQPLQGVGHQGGQYVFRRRVDEAAIWADTRSEGTSDAYRRYIAAFPLERTPMRQRPRSAATGRRRGMGSHQSPA